MLPETVDDQAIVRAARVARAQPLRRAGRKLVATAVRTECVDRKGQVLQPRLSRRIQRGDFVVTADPLERRRQLHDGFRRSTMTRVERRDEVQEAHVEKVRSAE